MTPRKPPLNMVNELDDGSRISRQGAATSVHDRLKPIDPRKPRARIVYETATDGALNPHELPFVVGVLGDFSGDPGRPTPPFSDRKFIQIDVDNFDEIIALIGPGLNLRLENTLAGDGSEIEVCLNFNSIKDFEPGGVITQVHSLRALLETRNKLRDSMTDFNRAHNREEVPQVERQYHQQIADIDLKLSVQLSAIMHSEKFLKLEGTWRGLKYLVVNSEIDPKIKIRLLNVTKKELYRELRRAISFDQSLLYKKIYTNAFGVTEGEPFGILIGDYEWTNHPDDIETLRQISNVAAAAFAPFISAASPGFLGLEDWSRFCEHQDLAKIFDTPEYARWRSFRDTDDSRFVCLVVPRVLARVSYCKTTKLIDEFDYEETLSDVKGAARAQRPAEYCWMNAAYVLGSRMMETFTSTGFCTAIRGDETGGRVEGLPTRIFRAENSKSEVRLSTETLIGFDRDDIVLSRLGFLPLLHIKNTDCAIFFSSSTANRPRIYDRLDASANAAMYAGLPCVMATSRFAHYLMFIARDKLFGGMEAAECERRLNLWINNYVDPSEKAGAEASAAKPLLTARVEVREIPGQAGCYNAIAYLRLRLQFAELTTCLRVVARIPNG